MPKLELNRKGVRLKLTAAWGRANERLEAGIRTQIESPVFPWPRETLRRNGERVGSPRSAVDRGDFRDGYRRTGRGTQQVHAFTAPHSAVVILGARLRSGVTLPPRDVTAEPLKTLPAVFAEEADK